MSSAITNYKNSYFKIPATYKGEFSTHSMVPNGGFFKDLQQCSIKIIPTYQPTNQPTNLHSYTWLIGFIVMFNTNDIQIFWRIRNVLIKAANT